MTQEHVPTQEAQAPARPVKYVIDEAWYERQGRSFEYMVQSRVEGLEVVAEKSTKKKSKAAAKAGTSLEDLARIEGFISPNLPVLEAVFRLLLVHQNKPLEVDQIAQELAEHGIGVMDARVINPVVLARMLDGDFHYGIVRFQEDQAKAE